MADFEAMMLNCQKIRQSLSDGGSTQDISTSLALLQKDLSSLRDAERGDNHKVRFREYLFDLFKLSLDKARIIDGTIAEIGGSMNSFLDEMPQFKANFLSIFPSKDPRFIVADITNCPHVPDEAYDAIFSVSVLEHVQNIQCAAQEVVRLLKPGGLTMHAVPFSYFFHGAPVDYWRVTTTAMQGLFEELDTIDCFFYSENRRRNNMGSVSNPIDEDGGPKFSPDAFGGWRENWFTIYIGRKSVDSAGKLAAKRSRQLAIDLVKGLTDRGRSEDDALASACKLITSLYFDSHGRVRPRSDGQEAPPIQVPEIEELRQLWLHRSKRTVRPSVGRYNILAMLEAARLV